MVIVPALRGRGHSQKTGDGYNKVTVAEDVRRIVQAAGFATVRLVGADLGAMVAYAYAARYPDEMERVRRSRRAGQQPMKCGDGSLDNPEAVTSRTRFQLKLYADYALSENCFAGVAVQPTSEMMSATLGINSQAWPR